MRKGEIRALKKADVDLRAMTITVRASGTRETTKGGHIDVIPIHPELGPYLRAAMDASRGVLAFPKSGGKMYRPDVDLCRVLRRAMRRAGLVEGYEIGRASCRERV